MAPTSITSTTTTPAEWEPHTAPTTTASPSSNANTTRTTPFGSTRTSLPDNSRRLKGHGDSASHLSGDREASGHSGGSRWGISGSRVVLDGDPVSSLRQEPSMDQRGLGTSDASAPRLTRGEPRTRRGWLGNGSSIEQRSSERVARNVTVQNCRVLTQRRRASNPSSTETGPPS